MNLSPSDWAYIEERTGSFVGREWVFARIRSFLSGPPGTFLLHGDPGTGKTAIAARLAQASCGRTAANSLPAQPPVAERTISAAVFCRAGRMTAVELIQRLSGQLAASVEGFVGELQSTLAPGISIRNVRVETGPVTGDDAQVSGVRFELGTLSDERAFNGGVAVPLRRLRDRGAAQPIVLLVDAVDEAAEASGINVFSRLLARLDGIHLIVTCRPDPRVLADFRAARHQVDLVSDAPPSDQDVRVYIGNRLRGRGPDATMGVLGDRIADRAASNFLYAFYVTGALVRSGSLADMDDLAARRRPLPVGGLPGVYEEFLDRQIAGDDDKMGRGLAACPRPGMRWAWRRVYHGADRGHSQPPGRPGLLPTRGARHYPCRSSVPRRTTARWPVPSLPPILCPVSDRPRAKPELANRPGRYSHRRLEGAQGRRR